MRALKVGQVCPSRMPQLKAAKRLGNIGPHPNAEDTSRPAPLGADRWSYAKTLANKNNRDRRKPAPSRAARHIPKSSKGHFVGELVFNRGEHPQRLGFASKLEHDTALCLIYRPGFADLEEQLAALPFAGADGKVHNHYFDFRLTQANGRRICISVKPERIAETALYTAMFDRVKSAAIGRICHHAVTVTERNLHPIELHNARLFHAARDAQPEIDFQIEANLDRILGATPISEFLKRIGLGGAGFFGVARAIRQGHLALFARDKITANTLIVPGVA